MQRGSGPPHMNAVGLVQLDITEQDSGSSDLSEQFGTKSQSW